jgi:MFS family permease
MRGRYLGVAGLTWPIGTGIGPVLGGLLSDTLGPAAIWIGAFWIGLAGAVCYAVLARRNPQAGGQAATSP